MYYSNVTLVFLVLILTVKGEEKNSNNTNSSILTNSINAANLSNVQAINNDKKNATEKNVQSNVTVTERIVQPVMPPKRRATTEKPLRREEMKKFEDFKPSPLLETKYEINRYVKPANAEAKFATSGHNGRNAWLEKNRNEFDWNKVNFNNQIKFPQAVKAIAQTVSDRPYPFVNVNDNYDSYNNNNYNHLYDENVNNKKQDEDIGLQPPVFGYLDHGGSYQNPQVFTQVEKYETNEEGRYKPDYTDLEIQEKPYGIESQFPWRKIVKFLTTFVPIGILLSALIPNVISITPINTTQSRARVNEDETKTKMQLVYSSKLAKDLKKKGCDHRILCELLLGAGYSRNREENAEHLLQTYVEKEQEIAEKTEELKRIMIAVSSGSCDQFKCKAFNESYGNNN